MNAKDSQGPDVISKETKEEVYKQILRYLRIEEVNINDLVSPTIGPILDDFGTQQCTTSEKEEFCCSAPGFDGVEKFVLIIKVKRSSAGLAMKDMRNGNGVRICYHGRCVSDAKQDGCMYYLVRWVRKKLDEGIERGCPRIGFFYLFYYRYREARE